MNDNKNSNTKLSIATIYSQEQNGVSAGTFINGRWIVRKLNKIKGNLKINLNLNKNTFTIPKGIYNITCRAPAFAVDNHQTRLFNVSQNKPVAYGSSEFSSSVNISSQTSSFLSYYIELNTHTEFRLEHCCQTTKVTNGLGVASYFTSNDTDHPEIYCEIQIIQLN